MLNYFSVEIVLKLYYSSWYCNYSKSKISNKFIYVPAVTLSIQNIKLLIKLESGFKRTINWNKYLTKTTNQARNRYLDYITGPWFQKVNKLFVLWFEDDDGWESHKQYYLPNVEIKNIMLWSKEETSLINQ